MPLHLILSALGALRGTRTVDSGFRFAHIFKLLRKDTIAPRIPSILEEF